MNYTPASNSVITDTQRQTATSSDGLLSLTARGISNWFKSTIRYQWRFHPTAYCCLKLFWEENTYAISRGYNAQLPTWGALISSNPMTYEWLPAEQDDGTCVPRDFDPDVGKESTWPVSDVYTMVVPEENRGVKIENIRWTMVKGYEPPADGNANGFPKVTP